MNPLTRGALAAIVLVGASACAVVFDFSEPLDPPAAAAGSESESARPALHEDDDAAPPVRTGSGVVTVPVEAPPAPPPVCAGSCIPAIPADWMGPLALVDATGDPPACAGEYATFVLVGHAGPIAPPSACSCTCGAASGATCSEPATELYSDTLCAHRCGETALGPVCSALSRSTGCVPHAVSVGPSVPSGGACTPVAGVQWTPPAWTTTSRLCAGPTPTAIGCAAGNVCAAAPSVPYDAHGPCVARKGIWSCPAGFASGQAHYASGVDERACTACSCGAPSGVECHARLSKYNRQPCATPNVQDGLPVACLPVSVDRDSLSVAPAVPEGGTCAAAGGDPVGDFVPVDPTTICCVH